MKKFLALLCVIALITLGTVPALANPSIGDIKPVVERVEIVVDEENPTNEVILKLLQDEGWKPAAVGVNLEIYENEDVKASIIAVNSNDTVETPAETVARLMEHQTESSAANIPVNLSSYQYVTDFVDFVITDGDTDAYMDETVSMSIRVSLQSDALRGVKKEDLGNYLIMQINPVTGEIFFTEIDPDSFDSETGLFTTDFHVLGPFTIIQKV